MRDETGAPAGAVLLFKDLTRVEQLEERERLKDRLAAIGEMAAAIAHEVKNPLASIEVLAGLLKRRLKEAPEAVAVLNEIIHEAKMANAIVVDVLDFARPLRLQVEEVDLGRVIGDAVHLARRAAEPGQVEVRLDLAPSLSAIKGDASQIRQLVANLVANAFEALAGWPASAPDTPAIVVKAFPVDRSDLPEGRGVAIEVTDNGPGVPPELGERVFGPFVSTKPKGSGLGLANVRKVVDAHGGRVSVGAGREGGAAFTVLLPHAPPHDSRLPDADTCSSPPAVRAAAGF
jgi:two-component system nitrogen regulation sensor histidine kinase GlnL